MLTNLAWAVISPPVSMLRYWWGTADGKDEAEPPPWWAGLAFALVVGALVVVLALGALALAPRVLMAFGGFTRAAAEGTAALTGAAAKLVDAVVPG